MRSTSELPGKPVGPARFFGIGVFLFAIKFALDHFIARTVFGQDWSIFNYLIPNEVFSIPTMPPSQRWFYLAMLAFALPFVGVGILVTLRRLHDAALPGWLVGLFFVPVINLLFFAMLSVIPSAKRKSPPLASVPTRPVPAIPIALDYGLDDPAAIEATLLAKFIPRSTGGAAVVALAIPAIGGVLLTLLAASFLRNYGLGFFVGMPFFIGMASAILFGYRTPRTLRACVGIGLAAGICAAVLLILFAMEGLGCLILFLPMALPIAVVGATVGYAIQRRPDHYHRAERSLWSISAALPAMILIEGLFPSRAPVLPVTTIIDIDAPPAIVWQNVIAFGRIDAPLDWPFRAGIAYPIQARIEGTGVGAIRYCEFSTGPFVEPIQIWDSPRLLKFAVTQNPPPMTEWSPFHIQPPHMHDVLLSHGGQFHLIALANGRTRVEGTTWYENRMWPQVYWRAWSDFLIHRIHLRVLLHIKHLSEAHA